MGIMRMDIVKMIKVDNEELFNRLVNLSEPEVGRDSLSAIRLWCWDALSSEVAKEKVLYQRIEKLNPLSQSVRSQFEEVRRLSKESTAVINELMNRDLKDYDWPQWYRSTINLFQNKNRAEEFLLDELPKYFNELELGKMVTQFERAREYEVEIGEFQTRNVPHRT